MKNKASSSTHDKKISLEAQTRTVFGKKLLKLRHQGSIPANIYGPEFKSMAITINQRDFLNTFKVAKETAVVYIKVGSEEIPALIKNIQTHPVNNHLLHVDFRKINLKQKITTEVPVKITGVSEAVNQKGGVLLTQMTKLLVEALPQDIPQAIEVDISVLKEIGNEIKVSDLIKSNLWTIKDGATKVVISVVAHKEESITPETTATTPEVITEKPTEGEAVSAEAGAKAEPTKEAPKTETKPAKPETKK